MMYPQKIQCIKHILEFYTGNRKGAFFCGVRSCNVGADCGKGCLFSCGVRGFFSCVARSYKFQFDAECGVSGYS